MASPIERQAGQALINRIEDVIWLGRCIVQLDIIVQILQITSRIVRKEYLE